jgi:hypothetical protein
MFPSLGKLSQYRKFLVTLVFTLSDFPKVECKELENEKYAVLKVETSIVVLIV